MAPAFAVVFVVIVDRQPGTDRTGQSQSVCSASAFCRLSSTVRHLRRPKYKAAAMLVPRIRNQTTVSSGRSRSRASRLLSITAVPIQVAKNATPAENNAISRTLPTATVSGVAAGLDVSASCGLRNGSPESESVLVIFSVRAAEPISAAGCLRWSSAPRHVHYPAYPSGPLRSLIQPFHKSGRRFHPRAPAPSDPGCHSNRTW